MHSSSVIITIDALVVGLNVLVFRQIEIALYSAIAIFIMGKAIDILLEGIYFTKMIFIVSEKYEKIAKIIAEDVQRGITGIHAKGMYTNNEKMLLLCVVGRGEVNKIKKLVSKLDPCAFLIISNAREVFGEGFKT